MRLKTLRKVVGIALVAAYDTFEHAVHTAMCWWHAPFDRAWDAEPRWAEFEARERTLNQRPPGPSLEDIPGGIQPAARLTRDWWGQVIPPEKPGCVWDGAGYRWCGP